MRKSDKNTKFRLPISAYISYLMLASVLLTGVSFSKYVAKTTSINEARVAIFNIDTQSTSATSFELEAGGTANYSFKVKNLSEVAVDYKLIVENLPTGVSVTVSDGMAYDYLRGLSVGGEQNLTLEFKADNDVENIDGSVKISVDAQQRN